MLKKKNKALTGLTRVMCPILNESLKTETKMPDGLRLSSLQFSPGTEVGVNSLSSSLQQLL